MATTDLYWLSRNGGTPEGPYTLEQIRSLFDRAEITATASVREDGVDLWEPVAALMARSPRNRNHEAYALLALFGGLLGAHNFYGRETNLGIVKLIGTTIALALIFTEVELVFVGWSWLIGALIWILCEIAAGPHPDHIPAQSAANSAPPEIQQPEKPFLPDWSAMTPQSRIGLVVLICVSAATVIGVFIFLSQ